MGNAPRRADRLKRETIGGEEFTDAAAEPAYSFARAVPAGLPRTERVPTTLSVDPQADKLAKVKAIMGAEKSFKSLLVQLGSSRSLSIARQRIEEARMWAVDGVINERVEKPQA